MNVIELFNVLGGTKKDNLLRGKDQFLTEIFLVWVIYSKSTSI